MSWLILTARTLECGWSLEPLLLNSVTFESWAFHLENGVTCLPVIVP